MRFPRKKTVILVAAVLLLVAAIESLLTPLLSEAYPPARLALMTSSDVAGRFGTPHGALLVGSGMSLSAVSPSCQSFTFLLVGDQGGGLARVYMRREKFHDPYAVHDVVPSWRGEAKAGCRA